MSAYLAGGTLVGVLSGWEQPSPQGGQLGLEDGDAPPSGRHELVGRLQGGAQGAMGHLALPEH